VLSVVEALEVIRCASPRVRTSQQPLNWTLSGRVLAADVFAAVSLPPFATSAMDGYAVHAADLGGAPVPIAFRVAAGDPPGHLPAGSSAGIATGAPLPEGADAVVPIEDAREQDLGQRVDHPGRVAGIGDHRRELVGDPHPPRRRGQSVQVVRAKISTSTPASAAAYSSRTISSSAR